MRGQSWLVGSRFWWQCNEQQWTTILLRRRQCPLWWQNKNINQLLIVMAVRNREGATSYQQEGKREVTNNDQQTPKKLTLASESDGRVYGRNKYTVWHLCAAAFLYPYQNSLTALNNGCHRPYLQHCRCSHPHGHSKQYGQVTALFGLWPQRKERVGKEGSSIVKGQRADKEGWLKRRR